MLKKPPHNIRVHRDRHLSDGSRQQHKRALVIYTGKVTEEEILRSLKFSVSNGVLDLKYQKNIADALEYAQKAIDTAKYDDPYDRIFIVADVDNLSSQALKQQRNEASDLETPTSILLSNPCIEVWIACYDGNPPRDKIDTIKSAQSYVASKGLTYGRDGKRVHVENLSNHFAAVKTAKRLNACCGTPPDFTVDAPTTELYQLIEFLRDEFKK